MKNYELFKMGFTIDQVVPWGRNLEEYQRMFALLPESLDKKILGCGDGPASVNAELFSIDKDYTSLDPIYQFSAQQIRERIEATATVIKEQLTKNQADYIWDYYQSPKQLVKTRLAAMELFLQDFEQKNNTNRYVIGTLPSLPFEDDSFDLVICSHFLFAYSEQLDEEFHQKAILEMCRVGRELRIFPLLEISGKASRHLNSVVNYLENQGIHTEILTVDYEFQKGGNQMLKLTSVIAN
ncbi:methyltransferase domain-containing protein [Tunicatimonas pelagia]|uniref:methyltransferase domain-containing protein n=1 Tax=Tunicatimonas pelagia TaxID=931531 RepID=UPI002666A74B|nr:methyltransferase domain-containing protein [Tunicatimonas pelagia]WKN41190.1 methyltransferase domain-containing protein [Tunicatimonas pelagia]